jgi:hypothetical protein
MAFGEEARPMMGSEPEKGPDGILGAWLGECVGIGDTEESR